MADKHHSKNPNRHFHVAVACGGTGGHVMPGLATAQALQQRGHTVTLWLTGKPVEDQSIADWSGGIIRVPARGFPTRPSPSGLMAAWKLHRAVNVCRQKMLESSPDVLLAMGSYASAGPVMAARKIGIPYVLHEANVLPGRAIRFLARRAATVACHFDASRYYLPRRCTIKVTGMPLRSSLTMPAPEPLAHHFPGAARTILIMGGSRGARALNESATEAIGNLAARGFSVRVLHLTGSEDVEWVRERYADAAVPAWVEPFHNQMQELYALADMAICRAGASTCAELAHFGVPALMVPYPYAANDHQTVNARVLEKQGAADVVAESSLSVPWLVDYLEEMIQNPERLDRMRTALRDALPSDGANALADLVLSVATARELDE